MLNSIHIADTMIFETCCGGSVILLIFYDALWWWDDVSGGNWQDDSGHWTGASRDIMVDKITGDARILEW